jgi:hypothetical protein
MTSLLQYEKFMVIDLPLKPWRNLYFCLRFLSTQQWPHWNCFALGLWEAVFKSWSFAQAKRLCSLMLGLSLSFLDCNWDCLPQEIVLSLYGKFVHEKAGWNRAQGARCKISFFCTVSINPKSSKEGLQMRGQCIPRGKNCPMECAPVKPVAGLRTIWSLPGLSAVTAPSTHAAPWTKGAKPHIAGWLSLQRSKLGLCHRLGFSSFSNPL